MSDVPSQKLAAARAQFQDVRNALFLAQLLSSLDQRRSSDPGLDQIITQVEEENGFMSPVPLVNQATFLQMAYMTLVYPKEGVIGEVVDGKWEPRRLDWARVTVVLDDKRRFKDGPDWHELLHTLRNALAHSAVEVGEDTFTFTDTDPRNGKKVVVKFDWQFLGELTIEFFEEVSGLLYSSNQ